MAPSSWKRDVARGLVVLVPLLITSYILAILYRALARLPFLEQVLPNQPTYVQVGLVLVVFALLVLSVGYLMRTTLGDIAEGAIDAVINWVPGLRVVYNASKMAVETAVSGADELQEPVKVETWNGMRMTAFKTGKSTPDGRDVLFVPTSPNITTGFVVEVEPSQYEATGESVEAALTRVLSAGFGEGGNGMPIDVKDEKGADEREPVRASNDQR
jgi:uncharacterized membrane protein